MGRRCADLLEEVIYDDDHSSAEVGSTEEIGPWSLMHILLKGFANGLNLHLAVSVGGVNFGSQTT